MFNSDNLRLDGKCAIITGAGAGIGKEIAITFATAGASVVVSDINADAANHVVDEIQQLGGQAFACRCDITSEQELSALADFAISKLGKVDILVNNAGIVRDMLMVKMTEADFDAVINVNLKGTYNMMKATYKHFMKQRSGRIISLASVVGIMGNAGQANYSASKAGIIGLTKSVAKELGGRNVTVNAIAPGYIATDMTDQLSDKAKDMISSGIPMKRAGSPEDVANAICFLASDDASYITGEVLRVDGGMAM